jgi:uncharacterized protein (TIGR01319 family)
MSQKCFSPEQMTSVVVTDCGSTTTKAVWFEKTDSGWRQTYRAEAPTTVEKPVADVTIGVINALGSLELMSDRSGLCKVDPQAEILRRDSGGSIDHYFSTSSAGGGLQMVVLGLVSQITGKSAERAALGAGAIVLARICLDDEAPVYQQAEKIRELRPDIILLTGGSDGGAKEQVRELAEILLLAEPKPRFGEGTKVPVIFAGNQELSDELRELLQKEFDFKSVPNIRPVVDSENLVPAREATHDVFLEHVMSQAPGYNTLSTWVDGDIMPTPVAVSKMIEVAAKKLDTSIIAVDIGGATTDIFSIRKGENGFLPVHRTVSANLGMSYSVGNVIELAGSRQVQRWLPFSLEEEDLRDALWNKMYRPTTIPQTLEELHIEHAVAREALRLSFEHHKQLSEKIEGAREVHDIGKTFRHQNHDEFDISGVDFILGSGGVLSHAPLRASAALMLIDSFEPEGITRLGVDSIFMLPHLGVFSQYHETAALEVLFSSCIIPLGTAISPKRSRKPVKAGEPLADIELSTGIRVTLKGLELRKIPLGVEESCEITIRPRRKDLNFGAGAGKTMRARIEGGEVGIILDGRCGTRNFSAPGLSLTTLQKEWNKELGIETI